MSKLFVFHYDIFKQLLRAKFTDIRSMLIEKIINIYIWAGCTILVMGYLMQSFGLAKNFGLFQFTGILAVIGLFELYSNTASLIADFEGDRIITYYLMLPSSAVTVLLSYICYYLFISMSISLAILPLGKLVLWNQFNLTGVAWGSLFAFMVLINLVWASLAFVLAAHIPEIKKLGVAWCRVIFPLWFLGGFQFSWKATHLVCPLFSYFMLLNPVIYATEGIRAAFLGQEGYLPFWACFCVMFTFCLMIHVWAFKSLRRRLDFV